MSNANSPWHFPDPSVPKQKREVKRWYLCHISAFRGVLLTTYSREVISDVLTLQCRDQLDAQTRSMLMALSRWDRERYSHHHTHCIEVSD